MDSSEDPAHIPLETAINTILNYASDDSTQSLLFDLDREQIDSYLQALDHLQRSVSDNKNNNNNNINGGDDIESTKVNSTIQIAMAKLEQEFRHMLITHTSPIPTDSLTESISSTNLTNLTNSFNFPDSDDVSLRGDDVSHHHRGDDVNEVNEDSVHTPTGDFALSRGESVESGSVIGMRSMSSILEIDLIPSEVVHDLRHIAQRMINARYFRECVHVYATVRKSAVDAAFKKLGVEQLSVGDIQQLEWEALNAKIRRWIRAARVCVRVLFASEKRLCEQIFEKLGTDIANDAADACFMETVKAPAIQLLNFAEAISITRRSPEKLFKILDLHDALLDLLPDIDTVFDSVSSESIRIQASEILSRLAEAARGMLSEFEEAVLREQSKVPVPGGTIHPLTRYVMNYISLISDYKQTLGELIVSRPVTGSRYSDELNTPEMDFNEHEGRSPLALHLIWITIILQSNLEGKSKHYKDNSLSYVFIMNNIHYIVQKIKGSPELREMIGDNYLRKLTGKYRQAATRYQRATWVGVLHCLRDEGLHSTGSFSSGVSKSALRERFKSFNSMFEEVHKMQALWLIPDTQLREELQISISEKLIPAYRSFLGRFRTHIEHGRHPENYIKYTVESLEAAVMDFFEGATISQLSRRRSV